MSDAGMSRILVIGGSRGVGLLIARLLQERGYAVRVLARDPAAVANEAGPTFEVVAGDLTKRDTLSPALRDVDHVIFTAGAPSGRYAPESLVEATDYGGVIHTLATAHSVGFRGRFVYLNTIGIKTPSVAGFLINLLKRNTLVWRRLPVRSARRHARNRCQPGCAAAGIPQPYCPRRCRRSVRRGDDASPCIEDDF
jgi:NADPH:quinone reductase-like Zn-dependent oxidoreductase